MKRMIYRAWDKEHNEYIHVANIDLCNEECSGLPIDIRECQDSAVLPYLDTLEVYTGIDDINKRKIFVGDIVEMVTLNEVFPRRTNIYLICDNGFTISHKSMTYELSMPCFYTDKMLLLGNIREASQELKDKIREARNNNGYIVPYTTKGVSNG